MKHILTIVFVSIVYNCSTPYQPKVALGGYSSNQLNENNYRVSFNGNQHTSVTTVFDYLLDQQPVIDANPHQTLQDQKTKIVRTYYSGTIDNESTDVVGIYKIQIFDEQIEGYEDYFFSAFEILKNFY